MTTLERNGIDRPHISFIPQRIDLGICDLAMPTGAVDGLHMSLTGNCFPELVAAAKMGSIYMENIEKIEKPRVAIVNIGDEEEKGNALVKETYPLLKECKDINFVGSIEAREIPNGAADVIVCEAFVGNVILKLYEGLAKMLLGEIKKAVMSSFKSKIGGALIKDSLGELKERFNAKTKGGAPLLGLKGLVVKIHGNSHNEEVKSAIFQCINFSETGVNAKIAEKLSEEQA